MWYNFAPKISEMEKTIERHSASFKSTQISAEQTHPYGSSFTYNSKRSTQEPICNTTNTYVTAWGRTTTPPVHRLGRRGDSAAIADLEIPAGRRRQQFWSTLYARPQNFSTWEWSTTFPAAPTRRANKKLLPWGFVNPGWQPWTGLFLQWGHTSGIHFPMEVEPDACCSGISYLHKLLYEVLPFNRLKFPVYHTARYKFFWPSLFFAGGGRLCSF